MSQPELNPDSRADILDILRGFALIGVLLDNLFGFTGWGFLPEEQKKALATWPADGILGLIELAFVHGKFYSLFSLLFGIGFSVILVRNQRRGINPLGIFYRRLLILAIIGALHLFFIWEGDILFLYAIIGLTLPMFRNCSDKTILVTAAVLILSPILIDVARIIADFSPGGFMFEKAAAIDVKNNIPKDVSQYLFEKKDAFQHWRNWMEPGYLYRYGYILDSNRIPKVLGMFLLGFYAGRKLIFVRLEENTALLKKLKKWGFIIGIPMSIGMAIFEIDGKSIPAWPGMFDTITYALGVVPLSLAYTATLCLWWIKKKEMSRLKVFAPMGRMALTNYLAQTFFGIVIYYGIGFGLGGDIGPTYFFPIGIALYIFQLIYSRWWMKYFNYGPFEWIWRMLTYGKYLPFRKRADQA